MVSFSKQQRICHLFCGFHARHCFMQAFVGCGTYDKISGSAAFAWSVLCCRDFKIGEDNYKIDSHYNP
jgi:hypothetical protein